MPKILWEKGNRFEYPGGWGIVIDEVKNTALLISRAKGDSEDYKTEKTAIPADAVPIFVDVATPYDVKKLINLALKIIL